MGSLEFMNQDGEWEKFPTDEEMAVISELKKVMMSSSIPMESSEVSTVCYLCNEPFPIDRIRITGGNPIIGYTWSCPKCHAITSTGKA